MSELPLIAIVAALLIQFVLAQHIGLRTPSSLREVIGVGATIISTTIIAALIDWILLQTVLQPFDIIYLRLFISVMLAAAITPLAEVLLRSRFKQWFPAVGNFPPLTMTTSCTLIAAEIGYVPQASLLQTMFNAIAFSIGAVFLLAALQALRDRNATQPPLKNLPACDALHAVFIFIALCGVLSIA